MDGEIAHHDPYNDPYVTDDTFYQPGDLYRLMTEEKRAILIENTRGNIEPVTDNIKYRHAAHCFLADKEYGTRIAAALNLTQAKVEELAAMDREARLHATSHAVWNA